MEILLIGLSHRTAPLVMRERVAFDTEQASRAAGQLRAQGILEETLVLSTCNRSELYGVPPEAAPGRAEALEQFLASFHNISLDDLDGSIYRRQDREAVRHLFRVSAGLDSMLLGEAEILGQVRDAYRVALEHGHTGPILNRLFQAALEVGKRVRAETELGSRPMSVAFAGVKLAERIFGKLRGHSALILGAGAMGGQVAEHMLDRGLARILVSNRSKDHRDALARRIGGEAIEWERFPEALVAADVLVASVTATEHVVMREMVDRAMSARGSRALFIIDLGVPRNVEASAAELYNVYLYNIDDLKEIVDQNRKAREGEIPRAEAIVEEQVAKFEDWQASVQSVDLVSQLRRKLGRDREEFLEARLRHIEHLSAADRDQIEKLTEELLERVLLEPAERLRATRGLRRKLTAMEVLRDLFGLRGDKP